MSISRRSARVTDKIAKFIEYNSSEENTNIGTPSAPQFINGYKTSNVQSAIDGLYKIATVPVGELYTSQYNTNPNPVAWGDSSLSTHQKDIVTVDLTYSVDETIIINLAGIDVSVDITNVSTEADIISAIDTAFSGYTNYFIIDDITATTFSIEYVSDFIPRTTGFDIDFGVTTIINLDYVSDTVADTANEIFYGKWIYFGESTIDTPPSGDKDYAVATGTTTIYYWERIE